MRLWSSVAVMAVVVSVLVGAPAQADTVSWDGASTMLGGTSTYDAGEWIHQDFVYDDYGADTQATGANQIVSLAGTAGDFRYPTAPRYGHNAADIAEVRVQPDGDDLAVRVTMNTLRDEGTTAIGVAISELVHIPEDPGTPWPFAAGVRSIWDRFVTVGGGTVYLTDGDGTTAIGSPTVDLAENTITFAIPDVTTDGVGLIVGAGLWDAKNTEWLAGDSGNDAEDTYSTGGETDVRVFDVAFNTQGQEPRPSNWMEDTQADMLAAGNVRSFEQGVNVAALRGEGPVAVPAFESGFYNRIFRSGQTHLAEGVNPDDFPQYNGLYQPYGLWVPDGYDPTEPTPFLLQLHSLSVHHNQYAGGARGESFATMYEQLGDGLDAIVATPLARGPDGWYLDEGLVDTLEVWEDVRSNYAIDADRTYVSGYSMGGYGTYRLGTLMPDRFAGAAVWVGPPAEGIWAYPADPTSEPWENTYDQLESFRHIPTYIVHGTNDELVPITGVAHQAERFRELGHTYRFALHPGQDHLSFVYIDSWTRERDWLAGRERVTSPATVTFDVRPASWVTPGRDDADVISGYLSELAPELDSAYWVQDVAVAEGADVTGAVSLTSEAIAERLGDVTTVDEAHPGVTEDAPTTPYALRGADRSLTAAGTADVLTGDLAEVTELTVDLDGAGFSGVPDTSGVTVDREVTIRFVRDGSLVGSVTLTP